MVTPAMRVKRMKEKTKRVRGNLSNLNMLKNMNEAEIINTKASKKKGRKLKG